VAQGEGNASAPSVCVIGWLVAALLAMLLVSMRTEIVENWMVKRRLNEIVRVQDSLAVRLFWLQRESIQMYNWLRTPGRVTEQEYLDSLRAAGLLTFVDCPLVEEVD
jgi:uncharacterized membrane protein